MSNNAPAAVLDVNRPDPRVRTETGPDSMFSEADAGVPDDAADDSSMLRLVGAVATALVVLAAAGMMLA